MKIFVTGIGMVSHRGLGIELEMCIEPGNSAFLHAESLKQSTYHTPVFMRRRDRFTVLLIEAIHQAIAQANLQPPLDRVGLLVGSQLASWNTVQKFTQSLVADGPSKLNAAVFTNVSSNACQGQAAIQFGITGPVSMVQGGEGLSYALQLLKSGRAEQLLTVGADEFNPLYYDAMLSRGLTSEQPDRLGLAYDPSSAGAQFAEGSCCLVLETEESARRRGVPIYAEVVDAVVCSEGRGARTFQESDPEAEALIYAWKQLLSRNGLQPVEIGTLFTAANGVPSFDSAEQKALREVFGQAFQQQVVPVKEWFGETLGAAGHFATAFASYRLQQQQVQGEYCIVNTWEAPGTITTLLIRRQEEVSG